jgi:hypothetical protein
VLQKLKMGDILRRTRATDIPVAVIDSRSMPAIPISKAL